MLGIPTRYLLTHPRDVASLARDPVQMWTSIWDVYIAQREHRRSQCPYEARADWERRLHAMLGIPAPGELVSEFWSLWCELLAELDGKGIRLGPQTFGSWNDADAGISRAIWCLVRHLKPSVVIETGVAHGVTSRFILAALNKNEKGHLWSIDLPPIEGHWRKQVGVAVGECSKDRWTYIAGSSRLRLPRLLQDVRQVDLFIHDSLHSERNVRFELDRTSAVLAPHGAMVVDDIDANWGFNSFAKTFSDYDTFVCDAEPTRPDLRRFNGKGLFGILLKQPTNRAALPAKGEARCENDCDIEAPISGEVHEKVPLA